MITRKPGTHAVVLALALGGPLGALSCTKDLSELMPGPKTPEGGQPEEVALTAEELAAAQSGGAVEEGNGAATGAHADHAHGDPAAPAACCACQCAGGHGPHVDPPAAATPATPATGPDGPTPAASAAASAPPATSAPPLGPAAPAKLATGVVSGTVKGAPRNAAVVYVEGAPPNPKRGQKAVVGQYQMVFSPYFVAVSVGGKVAFYNGDPFPHNVFSPDQGGFNLGTWGKGGARSYTFKKPGVYTILCYMHPGMISYVAAVPSSYFGVVSGKGSYRIDGVPNGTYRLTAMGVKVASSTKEITVQGNTVTAAFTLEQSK